MKMEREREKKKRRRPHAWINLIILCTWRIPAVPKPN